MALALSLPLASSVAAASRRDLGFDRPATGKAWRGTNDPHDVPLRLDRCRFRLAGRSCRMKDRGPHDHSKVPGRRIILCMVFCVGDVAKRILRSRSRASQDDRGGNLRVDRGCFLSTQARAKGRLVGSRPFKHASRLQAEMADHLRVRVPGHSDRIAL